MKHEQKDGQWAHIAHNVASVRGRIASAAARAGRTPSDVTLVAVTKTRTPAEIEAAYRAGVRHLGENRVEEAAEKLPQLDLGGVTWHMVGHVQGRKARRAAELFDVVQSVDSVRLAHRLERFVAERDEVLPILIEVNVSGEETKYGFRIAERAELDKAIAEILALSHLRLEGLMTVAPLCDDPEQVRPVFARLRELLHELRAHFPQGEWKHLSMGMTDDYSVAVEEGATIVRIGRALFGPRAE
jgi:pyridoxal phosphate enzyme (YggS family)